MEEKKRTFQITIPSFRWRDLLNLKFLCIFFILALCWGGIYWWKKIHPFFHLENAILCVPIREICSDEGVKVLHSSLEEGDLFQEGDSLFSFATNFFDSKLLDIKIEDCKQQIDEKKKKLEEVMQRYFSLQGEQDERLLVEIQEAQDSAADFEKELAYLEKEKENKAPNQAFHAEFEGMILRWLKQPGEKVFAGQPVLLICSKKKRWIEASIPEERLSSIRIGLPAFINFPSFPGKRWNAQVSWISPIAEAGKIKIHLSAENLPLKPGLSAKASIKIH